MKTNFEAVRDAQMPHLRDSYAAESFALSTPPSRRLTRVLPCEDCSAIGRFGGCEDPFHRLLALDHQRLQPWAQHHGLNVACYYLQHPSSAPAGSGGGHWEFIETYRDDGLVALRHLETRRVSRNRQNRLETGSGMFAPARIRPSRFTIEDLSLDGAFPKEGYEKRMRDWVASILFERGVG